MYPKGISSDVSSMGVFLYKKCTGKPDFRLELYGSNFFDNYVKYIIKNRINFILNFNVAKKSDLEKQARLFTVVMLSDYPDSLTIFASSYRDIFLIPVRE